MTKQGRLKNKTKQSEPCLLKFPFTSSNLNWQQKKKHATCSYTPATLHCVFLTLKSTMLTVMNFIYYEGKQSPLMTLENKHI